MSGFLTWCQVMLDSPASPTPLQDTDLGVRHRLDQRVRFRIQLEELHTAAVTILGAQVLILATKGRGKPAQQHGPGIVRKQRIPPFGAPQQLDDVSVGARGQRLEFLNRLPVGAHGPSEPVGNCQNSGISHGCGQEQRPCPPTSWR